MASLSFYPFEYNLGRSTGSHTEDVRTGHVEKILEIVGAINLQNNYSSLSITVDGIPAFPREEGIRAAGKFPRGFQ